MGHFFGKKIYYRWQFFRGKLGSFLLQSRNNFVGLAEEDREPIGVLMQSYIIIAFSIYQDKVLTDHAS